MPEDRSSPSQRDTSDGGTRNVSRAHRSDGSSGSSGRLRRWWNGEDLRSGPEPSRMSRDGSAGDFDSDERIGGNDLSVPPSSSIRVPAKHSQLAGRREAPQPP